MRQVDLHHTWPFDWRLLATLALAAAALAAACGDEPEPGLTLTWAGKSTGTLADAGGAIDVAQDAKPLADTGDAEFTAHGDGDKPGKDGKGPKADTAEVAGAGADGTSKPLEFTIPSGPVSFQRVLGSGAEDEARAVVELPAGGFLAVGRTDGFGDSTGDGFLLRTDPVGAVVWARTAGASQPDELAALAPAAGGGALAAGSTSSAGQAGDAWLLRLDAAGLPLWSRVLGGVAADSAVALAPSGTGHLVLVSTRSLGGGVPLQRNTLIARVDSAGSLDWARVFWGTASLDGLGLAPARDAQDQPDGWLITGARRMAGVGQDDAWLLRLDETGAVRWSQSLGGVYDDRAYAAVQTADLGFVVTGSTRNFKSAKKDLLLFKVDAAGQMVWAWRHGGSEDEEGRALWAVPGGFAVAGTTTSLAKAKGELLLLTVDPQGQRLTARALGGSQHDVARAGIATSDGGWILAGSLWSQGAADVFLAKSAAGPGLECPGDDLPPSTFGSKGIAPDPVAFAPFAASPAQLVVGDFAAQVLQADAGQGADRCHAP